MLQKKKKKIAKLYIIYNFEICTDSSGINFSGSRGYRVRIGK